MEARAKEAAARSSQGLSLFVVVFIVFYLFPQSPANATADNGRKQLKGRELSPSVALGATKLQQPRLAGLRPREMPTPAKSIL